MGEGVAPCRTHRGHAPGSRALVEKQRRVSDHQTRRTVQRSRKQVGKRKQTEKDLQRNKDLQGSKEQQGHAEELRTYRGGTDPGPVSCTKKRRRVFSFAFPKFSDVWTELPGPRWRTSHTGHGLAAQVSRYDLFKRSPWCFKSFEDVQKENESAATQAFKR